MGQPDAAGLAAAALACGRSLERDDIAEWLHARAEECFARHNYAGYALLKRHARMVAKGQYRDLQDPDPRPPDRDRPRPDHHPHPAPDHWR